MQNYPNALLDDENNGAKNAWEFYFRQTCEESFEEVYQSKNVILGGVFRRGFIRMTVWNF
jgi:hypothetical protein